MTMTELLVFDPALCCSTGVCGPEVEPALVRFAADLEWLRTRGVEVRRFNLSQEPGAFAANGLVREALQREGTDCLPLLLVNGRAAARGRVSLPRGDGGLGERGDGDTGRPGDARRITRRMRPLVRLLLT